MYTKLLISLFFLTFMPSAFSKVQCFEKGKIRYPKNKKMITMEKSFCINHFEQRVLSYNCIVNKDCLALKSYRGKSGLMLTHGNIGTPSDRKCEALKGSPQLIEYFDGKKWEHDNLCFFDDDSFISVTNQVR